MSNFNPKNYDIETQKIRDFLKGICLTTKTLEKKRKERIQEYLGAIRLEDDPNKQFYQKLSKIFKVKECKKTLATMKNIKREVFEGGNPKAVKR